MKNCAVGAVKRISQLLKDVLPCSKRTHFTLPQSFLTDMPGWPTELRQRPVVPQAARAAFSHTSALTRPATGYS